MAGERRGDQCLSGICLGDRLSALPDIEWLATDEPPYHRDETNEGAYTYWRNLRPRFEDLWLHIHADRIWWATSRPEVSVGERREIDSETGVKRSVIPLWKATENGWSNKTKHGIN
jgi:hypothetical protein